MFKNIASMFLILSLAVSAPGVPWDSVGGSALSDAEGYYWQFHKPDGTIANNPSEAVYTDYGVVTISGCDNAVVESSDKLCYHYITREIGHTPWGTPGYIWSFDMDTPVHPEVRSVAKCCDGSTWAIPEFSNIVYCCINDWTAHGYFIYNKTKAGIEALQQSHAGHDLYGIYNTFDSNAMYMYAVSYYKVVCTNPDCPYYNSNDTWIKNTGYFEIELNNSWDYRTVCNDGCSDKISFIRNHILPDWTRTQPLTGSVGTYYKDYNNSTVYCFNFAQALENGFQCLDNDGNIRTITDKKVYVSGQGYMSCINAVHFDVYSDGIFEWEHDHATDAALGITYDSVTYVHYNADGTIHIFPNACVSGFLIDTLTHQVKHARCGGHAVPNEYTVIYQ